MRCPTGRACAPLSDSYRGECRAAPHAHGGALRAAGVSVRVLPVANHFFGEMVTVTGLLTGGDVLAALTPDKVADADELLLCS